MKLSEYLAEGHATAADLAAKSGISAASLSRIQRGGQNISLDVAWAISNATNYMVTVAEIVQDRVAAQ